IDYDGQEKKENKYPAAELNQPPGDAYGKTPPAVLQVNKIISRYPGTQLVYIDEQAKYIEIALSEYHTSGTDAACADASTLFYEICSLGDREYILKAKGRWIPSLVNPMDYEWARILHGIAGAPATSDEADIKDHRERIKKHLTARGISSTDTVLERN
ncbi:MAG: hypothetical protein L0Y73_02745, partial [Candidatus Aminicenantes bacterium]|nr:hypothetical protein [Candidatus Aminicenantes bacterium]